MPQALALLPIIIGGIGAATSIKSLVSGGPSMPKGPSPAEVTQNAIKAETTNRQSASNEASQFLPGIQANTSGGVSPDYYRQMSSLLSGNGNLADSDQFKKLVENFLGISGDSNSFGGGSGFGSGTGITSPGLTG